jgi:hypothetical protein
MTEKPNWSGDGSPEEIFQKALETMKGDHPVEGALVVAWYSRNEDGSGTLRYLHTGSDGRNLTALLSDLTFEFHISRRSIFGDDRAKVDVVYPVRKAGEQ